MENGKKLYDGFLHKLFLFIQVIYLNSFKDILKWMEISIVKHKKEPLKESTNKHESQ